MTKNFGINFHMSIFVSAKVILKMQKMLTNYLFFRWRLNGVELKVEVVCVSARVPMEEKYTEGEVGTWAEQTEAAEVTGAATDGYVVT